VVILIDVDKRFGQWRKLEAKTTSGLYLYHAENRENISKVFIIKTYHIKFYENCTINVKNFTSFKCNCRGDFTHNRLLRGVSSLNLVIFDDRLRSIHHSSHAVMENAD
jgi:hypothetical protein